MRQVLAYVLVQVLQARSLGGGRADLPLLLLSLGLLEVLLVLQQCLVQLLSQRGSAERECVCVCESVCVECASDGLCLPIIILRSTLSCNAFSFAFTVVVSIVRVALLNLLLL